MPGAAFRASPLNRSAGIGTCCGCANNAQLQFREPGRARSSSAISVLQKPACSVMEVRELGDFSSLVRLVGKDLRRCGTERRMGSSESETTAQEELIRREVHRPSRVRSAGV